MKQYLILSTILTIAIIGISAFFVSRGNNFGPSTFFSSTERGASWTFDGKDWQVKGSPPPCPDPLFFPSPVDVNLVSGILYPGQIRGGDYKPHGGFRFDALKSNQVDVYSPFDGKLFRAARHTSSGEIRYVLYFKNDCGLMYKFDHLLELTEEFKNILDSIRMGGDSDTRTTEINPPVFISKGELIATKVGLEKKGNVFMDFGVYDLRQKNGVLYDSGFRQKFYNIDEYGSYAICWLENLEEPAKSLFKKLPGADWESGSLSDYCN